MRKDKKAACVWILMSFYLFPYALGATYYIRSDAVGANDGSDWTNAYTSLPLALQRNHTYYIADGNYSSYTFDDAENGTQYITIKKATVADHGTDTGWDNSYGDGQAEFKDYLARFDSILHVFTSYWVIDGMSGSGSNLSSYGFKVGPPLNCGNESRLIGLPGTGYSYNPSYVTLNHIAVIECGSSFDKNQIAVMFNSPNSVSNNTIMNSYLANGSTNLEFAHCSNCLADHNYLDNDWSSASNHGAQFVIKESSNIAIKNNYFRNSCIFVIDGHVTGCTNNLSSTITSLNESRLTDDTQSWNPGQWNGKQVCKTATVNGSATVCFIVTNTGTNYLDVSPPTLVTDGVSAGNYYLIKSCYGRSDNISFYNNIIDTNSKEGTCGNNLPLVVGNGDSAYVDVMPNLKVYGNTFYNLSIGGQGLVWTGRQTNPNERAIVRNNLVYLCSNPGFTGAAWSTIPDYDYNVYLNCSGILPNETNTLNSTGDPFVDSVNYNFHLSSATYPGITLSSPFNFDFDGNLRGIDGVWDIGAYEFQTACVHASDNAPCDGCVDSTELTSFIDRWKVSNTDVTLKEIIEAIGLWKKGGCP